MSEYSLSAAPADVARRQAVVEVIDDIATELVQTLSDVIRIPSINPKYPGQLYEDHVGRESEVNAIIAEIYRSAGASVEMVTVEAGRDNACARIPGSGGGRSLLLNGHIDVVPANYAKWSEDPFSGRITDTAVHGRGATDNKGGVVAAAFAALALSKAGVSLRGDLVLQSVVGEEVGDHECGTTAAVKAGYGADAAIVVEPTSLDEGDPAYATATPGGLVLKMTLTGKAAHAGLAGLASHQTLLGEDLAVNVIDKYWIIYDALRRHQERWALTERHPDYAPGFFSIFPGVLEAHPVGSRVPFAVPDELVVEYFMAHHPDRDNRAVADEIEGVIAAAVSTDAWLTEHPPVLEWTMFWPPYNTPADVDLASMISAAHSVAIGVPDGSAPADREGFVGLCDATWLWEAGIPGVMYGPGVGVTAHTEGEYVPISQLITAAKTYALTAMEFCGVSNA